MTTQKHESLMPLKHTKPFCIEHAKDGAPFCSDHGTEMQVLIWDRKHPTHPIIAIEQHGEHEAYAFTREGKCTTAVQMNLVMTPLGYIDDKPVFVGDELLFDPITAPPQKHFATPLDRSFPMCTWPEPEKVYPETQMSAAELALIAGAPFQLHAIANAAIRHAIDAGQVAPVSEAKPSVRPHNPYTGRLRDPRDVASDPMGMLIRHPDEPVIAAEKPRYFFGSANGFFVEGDDSSIAVVKGLAERGVARDMAIAEAVRKAAGSLTDGCWSSCDQAKAVIEVNARINALILQNIIASVQP